MGYTINIQAYALCQLKEKCIIICVTIFGGQIGLPAVLYLSPELRFLSLGLFYCKREAGNGDEASAKRTGMNGWEDMVWAEYQCSGVNSLAATEELGRRTSWQ